MGAVPDGSAIVDRLVAAVGPAHVDTGGDVADEINVFLAMAAAAIEK